MYYYNIFEALNLATFFAFKLHNVLLQHNISQINFYTPLNYIMFYYSHNDPFIREGCLDALNYIMFYYS